MGKNEFMSLEWFKERIESSVDKALDARIGQILDKIAEEPNETPYLNIKMVNESLTVVFRDGGVVNKPNATEDHYNRIKVCRTKDEVLSVIYDREVAVEKEEQREEAKRLTSIAKGFDTLSLLKDFEVNGNCVTLAGTSRSMPQILIEKFTEVVSKYSNVPSEDLQAALDEDDEYVGLKNFFMWCCLNPRAEVAASLYGFLERNGMKITKQGFFVALRNVVQVSNSKKEKNLVDFISNAYNKVKAVWKKNPKEFCVVKTKDGFDLRQIFKDKDFAGKNYGNLKELYLNLPNMTENRYTDNWTRTFDIRIGQVVSMPSSKCNWSTQDCATAGLHFAGHTAPYVLCGDTSVFTLHNPMKVVGIGREKGRCWEYLPFMTTTVKEADAIMNSKDFDFLQLDEEYAIHELEGLAEKAKQGFIAEAGKYSFNLPSMSTNEINNIVLSLGEMKKTITKRISIIE